MEQELNAGCQERSTNEARKWVRQFVLFGLFWVVLVVLVLVSNFPSKPQLTHKPQVTILDRQLIIFAAESFRITNTFYLDKTQPWTIAKRRNELLSASNAYSLDVPGYHVGGRLEGQIRDRLRRWGLRVDPLPRFRPGKGPMLTRLSLIIISRFLPIHRHTWTPNWSARMAL